MVSALAGATPRTVAAPITPATAMRFKVVIFGCLPVIIPTPNDADYVPMKMINVGTMGCFDDSPRPGTEL
jgi:hypothetical protein